MAANALQVVRRLGELAVIRVGVTLPPGLHCHPDGVIRVVQAKNLRSDGLLANEGVLATSELRLTETQYLKRGDVVMQSRGVSYPAACVDVDLDSTVAASPLIVIRANVNRVHPRYLAFFLNSEGTQEELRREAIGTYVPQLKRRSFAELAIPMPSLEDQERIVDAYSFAILERDLNVRLAELRCARLRQVAFALAVPDSGGTVPAMTE